MENTTPQQPQPVQNPQSPPPVQTQPPRPITPAPSPSSPFGCIMAIILVIFLICGAVIGYLYFNKKNSPQTASQTTRIVTTPAEKNSGITQLPSVTPSPTIIPQNSYYGAANNTKRQSDVSAILNSIEQYNMNHPTQPLALPTTQTEIGNGAGQIDLCTSLVPKIIAALPADPLVSGTTIPSCKNPYHTGYTVSETAGRITISAPKAENGATISISR